MHLKNNKYKFLKKSKKNAVMLFNQYYKTDIVDLILNKIKSTYKEKSLESIKRNT